MRRVVLILVAIALGVPLIAAALLWRQSRSLSKPLVEDAKTLAAQRFEVTAAPQTGSVFDCVGPEADVAPDISRTLAWSDPVVLDVAFGRAPTSALSAVQRAELDAHREWMLRVFECGKRNEIVSAPGIGPFADFRHGRRQSMPRLMEGLSSIAPLTFRRELENGNADGVLDHCVDGLVVVAGWLRLEGFESMLPVLGPSSRLLAVCREAKARASPEALARFNARAPALMTIAPSYAEVIFVERTQTALRLFGAWIPDDLDAELPADARIGTRTQRESKWARGFKATLALRLYWKRFDAGMRELQSACVLAPAPRDAAIVVAQKHLEAPFLKQFFAADPVDLKYEMYSGYVDNLGAGLADLAR